MDGTKCIVVTCSASIVAASRAGSFSAPGGSKQSDAPVNDHQNNSHTDTSNTTGVFCNNTSCSVNGYRFCIHASRLMTECCSITTPLGRPVDPEVNMIYAAAWLLMLSIGFRDMISSHTRSRST